MDTEYLSRVIIDRLLLMNTEQHFSRTIFYNEPGIRADLKLILDDLGLGIGSLVPVPPLASEAPASLEGAPFMAVYNPPERGT